MNYFFTSDEHYGHANVIRFNNRPFSDVNDMTEKLIENHNSVVSDSTNNTTIHCGDFHWTRHRKVAQQVIDRLNGNHVFLMGSHDVWLKGSPHHETWEKRINGQVIVCGHYAMRTWAKSHYGSVMLYGHSHGNLESFGKSFDCGVDTHDYHPYSFEEVMSIMDTLPDNFNLIKK